MTEYAERDALSLEPHYSRHVSAMTTEQLHSKADIAAELAFRDQRIATLEAENQRLRGQVETLRETLAEHQTRARDALSCLAGREYGSVRVLLKGVAGTAETLAIAYTAPTKEKT